MKSIFQGGPGREQGGARHQHPDQEHWGCEQSNGVHIWMVGRNWDWSSPPIKHEQTLKTCELFLRIKNRGFTLLTLFFVVNINCYRRQGIALSRDHA